MATPKVSMEIVLRLAVGGICCEKSFEDFPSAGILQRRNVFLGDRGKARRAGLGYSFLVLQLIHLFLLNLHHFFRIAVHILIVLCRQSLMIVISDMIYSRISRLTVNVGS